MLIRSLAATGVVAILTLAVAGVAAAALPEFLVQSGGFPVRFEGLGGIARLKMNGVTLLECERTKVSGEITSAHAGTYKLTMENCRTQARQECHSTGDLSGVLLWSGEFHLARVLLSPVKVGMVMSLTPVVGCLGELVTREGKGFVLQITPINTFTTHYELLAAFNELGGQAFTGYYNEAGTLVTGVYLLLNGNEAALAVSPTMTPTLERSVEIVA